jgi:hypothetical protein
MDRRHKEDLMVRYHYFDVAIAQQVLGSALGDLLAAIVAYDDGQAGCLPGPRPGHHVFSVPESPSVLGFRVIDTARLLTDPPTAADSFLGRLDVNPIRHAWKDTVHRIGHELWNLGSLELMLATAERVAANPLDRPGRVSRESDSSHYHAIINSAWDGIGGWMA